MHLKELNPHLLWGFFYDLTQIPRPSKKEAKVIAYIENFANSYQLDYKKDETGNIVISKAATKGCEQHPKVVLQAHLDMVPQKNEDTSHDFETDPILAYIDNDWVKAKNTTLGADNGIGVAAALAVMASDNIQHPPLQALFTVDEETGMTGAFGLKPGFLNGDILINLDSEEEGALTIGCAGGLNATSTLNCTRIKAPDKHEAFSIALTGLKGGHSGMDIVLQRGNANKILNRLIWTAKNKFNIQLARFNGGSLRNAIPREAFAGILVKKDQLSEFELFVDKYLRMVKNELGSIDTDLSLTISKTDKPADILNEKDQWKLINTIYALPDGVMRMDKNMDNLVETSVNLASVKTEANDITIMSLLRSSVDSQKTNLANSIKSILELAGIETKMDGDYPGWQPKPQSGIVKTATQVYHSMYGKQPEVGAVHAGLECGLINHVYPNLECISFGPTIKYPHSPDEKVSIPSVNRFWDYLAELLKGIC